MNHLVPITICIQSSDVREVVSSTSSSLYWIWNIYFSGQYWAITRRVWTIWWSGRNNVAQLVMVAICNPWFIYIGAELHPVLIGEVWHIPWAKKENLRNFFHCTSPIRGIRIAFPTVLAQLNEHDRIGEAPPFTYCYITRLQIEQFCAETEVCEYRMMNYYIKNHVWGQYLRNGVIFYLP